MPTPSMIYNLLINIFSATFFSKYFWLWKIIAKKYLKQSFYACSILSCFLFVFYSLLPVAESVITYYTFLVLKHHLEIRNLLRQFGLTKLRR